MQKHIFTVNTLEQTFNTPSEAFIYTTVQLKRQQMKEDRHLLILLNRICYRPLVVKQRITSDSQNGAGSCVFAVQADC